MEYLDLNDVLPEGQPDGGKPHHKINAVEITDGFLEGCRLDFADGLNCIIGGRGTGKTTILEFIRYILDQMPDSFDGRPRAKVTDSIVRSNLGSGTIYLDVETKHGTRYRAERPWDDSAQVLDKDGDPVSISLDRDLIFKADIYSQNEIEEIATNPRFQLSLIDKFEEEAIRQASQEIQKGKHAIEASAAELRNLDERIRATEGVVPEVDVIAKRLAEMQVIAGPEADMMNAVHAHKALRGRETEAIKELRKFAGTVGDEFQNFATYVADGCRTALGDGLEDGPNGALFKDIERAVAEFVAIFQDGILKVRGRCDHLVEQIDIVSDRLGGEHARQEQHYREIIAKSAQEKQHAAERSKLQQRHLELTRARSELDALKARRKGLADHHRTLTSKLSDQRDRRFALRKGVAEWLSSALSPTIRVSMTQAGDRSAYRDLLSEALKGSGMQYNKLAVQIVRSVPPEELSLFARKGDAQRLAERAGIAGDHAQKLIQHLRTNAFVAKLETVDLDDEPLIELKDGADYKNSAGLSTGQRCTVILPIIMLESERPLLIDQPEDNLDNAFVYDTIVKSIREVKGGRQLIFVTHNPNIPVLGEAERVFVFTSDGRRATVTHAGTVEDVKGQIEHLLEGGKEAFKLRMRKYGH